MLFRIYVPLLSNRSKPHDHTDVVMQCSKNWFPCSVYYITVSSEIDLVTAAWLALLSRGQILRRVIFVRPGN